MKNIMDVFIGIVLNLWIALGSMDILTTLILLIHKQRISFHLFAVSSISLLTFFFFFLSFLPFLWLLPWHMEVPRLGVELEPVVARLHQSHSNAGSKPSLQPTPQLMATPDP